MKIKHKKLFEENVILSYCPELGKSEDVIHNTHTHTHLEINHGQTHKDSLPYTGRTDTHIYSGNTHTPLRGEQRHTNTHLDVNHGEGLFGSAVVSGDSVHSLGDVVQHQVQIHLVLL